jgi:hypothetical protein
MDAPVKLVTVIVSLVLFTGLAGLLSSCFKFWALPRSISVLGAKNDDIFTRTYAYLRAWVSYHRSRSIGYTTVR